MDNPQSFTSRRSAASNLPTFQLPPPDLGNVNKYPAYPPQNHLSQSAPQGVSVLTPPVGLASESPLSSSVNSGSSQSSTNGVPSYNPMGYWPPQQPNSQQYSFSSGPPMPSSFAQSQNSMYMARPLYSPPMNYPQQRTANAPASDENLPQPPYQLNLPPFPTNASMSASSGAQGQACLPNLSQQQQQPHPQNPQNQQQQLAHAMSNPQHPTSQPPQPSTIHPPSPYGPRPPPTPTYSYGPSPTPQQPSFPAYTQPSSQQSPLTSAPPHHRISPVSAPHPTSMHPPPAAYARPYSTAGYSLPQLSGPIMSNLHTPGNQMALVGGMPGGYAHAMYGQAPAPPQQQHNDRPFKCELCTQSFNRNHDLKRHVKIHLAIKPFPCKNCEKSFSRKDALKRHLLVKGCGKAMATAGAPTTTMRGSQSPVAREEVMSDSTEDSPALVKRELRREI